MSGCNVLFRQFFARWYRLPPGVRPPRMPRGDMEIYDGAVGRTVHDMCRLPAERRAELASQVATMVDAAEQDWRSYLDIQHLLSLDAIGAFDAHWTRPKIAKTIRASDPSDYANDYLVICCELGAVLGEVMRGLRPELEWLYDSPYWDSSLWHADTGTRIHVFHWAVKKMSAYGADDDLRAKVLAGIDTMEGER
jgi:hypothetical protein